MNQKGRTYEKLFLSLCLLSTLLVLTEIVLQAYGKSICLTEGCKVVSKHVRFGDLSILLIGLTTFASLALFSFLKLFTTRSGPARLINMILIVSLACEGFLTGYQVFAIHTLCLFCLIILGIVLVLCIIRLFAGEGDVIAGVIALGAVFGMFYLVPPPETDIRLPADEKMVLFFSKECIHCSEVMKELQDAGMHVAHVEVNAYSGVLKSFGVEHVPTLFINEKHQKMLLTGKDAIRSYLRACSSAARPVDPPMQKDQTRKKLQQPGKAVQDAPGGLFNQQVIKLQPGSLNATDNGMCKEDEKCR